MNNVTPLQSVTTTLSNQCKESTSRRTDWVMLHLILFSPHPEVEY